MGPQWFRTWREARIRQQAAAWLVRMEGDQLEQHRPAFEAWLDRDPDHARFYERQAALWRRSAQIDPDRIAALTRRQSGTTQARRTAQPSWWLAPAAAVAGGAVLLTWQPWRRASDQIVAAGTAIRTEMLADGSQIVLDRGSVVAVAFDAGARRLHLSQGRARFSVALDRDRPMLVRGGDAEVRTSAARFDMTVSDKETHVIVLDGALQLARYEAPEEPPPVALKPGEQAVLRDGLVSGPVPASGVDLSWPAGMISFESAPLQDVITAANRLGHTPIHVADAAIGALKVTGAYRAGDAAGLARSLAAGFGLKLRPMKDGSLLLFR